MIVELSRASFIQRLNQAKDGTWIMYHIGFLFEDRTKNRRLHALAATIWGEYEAGKVCLVQRRLDDKCCEYYVIKRRQLEHT
jgi:hypothetical protein